MVRLQRPIPLVIPALLVVVLTASVVTTAAQQSILEGRALLDEYCVTCHNERRMTAGLSLDQLDLQDVGRNAQIWEKVVRKLRGGSMPPINMPRPSPQTADAFVASLEMAIDRAALAAPDPGRPIVHRLNRTEYTNATRDLLAVDIDADALLPADESGFGFDNIADVLSLSPGLLERYLSAARKVSRLAVGDPAMRPVVATISIAGAQLQSDRMSEDLPFGSRGGTAFRHYFPLDGEYALRIHLHRSVLAGTIHGFARREEIDVRLDGERVELFAVGGRLTPEAAAVVNALAGVSGASRVGRDGPAGSLTQAQAVLANPRTADAGLETRFRVRAGTHVVGVTFRKTNAAPEGLAPADMPVRSVSFSDGDRNARMSIDKVDITGPFDATLPDDTPSRQRIFVCRPTDAADAEPCARTILKNLARRAYRRPVSDPDIEPLLGFYRARAEQSFDAGIQYALQRLLVSPEFLFRIQADPVDFPQGVGYRLSDVALASRLSFFLWSSIPDDELLDLAEAGQLSTPTVLEGQVQRMLADPRAKALVTNFTGQWLHLRNMLAVTPDPHRFPEFNDTLRDAFRRETELFFEYQISEDRSVVELLTADYTFVNEPLARHYGIPNIYGSRFRRVTLDNPSRAGLLGHASILTVTSDSTRTSPVKRGKWLLDNLLGTPPPPPPPDVPALPEDDEGTRPTSVRERLEQHRRNPACASCHATMDPLGFALENFDAVGRWRQDEAGTPVDASGSLPDGTTFSGPSELRELLEQRQTQFVGTVIEKLLTYALGRGIEFHDMPAVRTIARQAASNDYRWSALVLGVVKSVPFQMKRSAGS